jgi:ribosomal protein L29
MKFEEIKRMNPEEKAKKLKELKLELIKSRVTSTKSKTREIKKIIARILTDKKVEEKI